MNPGELAVSEGIIVAILTLIGVLFTGTMGYLGVRYSRQAAKSAKNVDDAVNHRHPSEPRLLDIIKEIRNSQALFQDRIDVIDLKLDMVHAELKEADRSADKRIHALENPEQGV